MEKLNSALLTDMYIHWTKKYGNTRNNEDLRFGQWIWHMFGDHLQSIKEKIENSESFLDGFYPESANTAYKEILKMLEKDEL